MQLCPGQLSGWLCLKYMFPSISPSLGRTAKGIQPQVTLSMPSCREVEGGRLCPSLKHSFGEVSIGRGRGVRREKEADFLNLANVMQVHIALKTCLREFVGWPPPVQVPLDTFWSCSCVPRAGENWLFPKFLFSFVGNSRKARV